MSIDNNRFIVQVYVGDLSTLYEALSVEASKQTTAEEIVSCIVERLTLNESPGRIYELAEVIGDAYGQDCKERSLSACESPVKLMMLWPKTRVDQSSYRFYLREKVNDYVWRDSFVMDPQLIKDYFHRFLYQPKDREYPDLCQLPDLNERTLLDNLKDRFAAEHIYTYVGSILIAVNPFKFYPIYNPKYVKLYQNQNKRLGSSLPPHIFAIADTAYLCMLKDRRNQCIVISGESGSGKTESTNFLLHHLTALSQKGSHGSGVEQTILSAGPVLEAFGNARTAHNNNSSRFGKFIQVNYKENGMVHGAVVQKYLLEKSRICIQGRNERNYHVFYYLLEGATDAERTALHLQPPDQYHYLNPTNQQHQNHNSQSSSQSSKLSSSTNPSTNTRTSNLTSTNTTDDIDKSYEFSRLKQSMEMVGFTAEKQRRLFSVLSAVLLLGNVQFQPRKSAYYHHDEAVAVRNPEVVQLISELLRVKQETLLAALTAKRARASGETLVINYRLPEAIASRDAMAKCLYGALFDWIVMQVNHALLSKKDTLREHQGNSIGVLDIFGFEDFGLCNSFEQLCINYANEHLQYYFNQHVFKYEQEEYRKEGIKWTNIDFMDNTGCLQLIEGKPNGLLCLLDDQCNFPGATNETLLHKFTNTHSANHKFYQLPAKREAAFLIVHYAGTVKYQTGEMREKNLDMMRPDTVGVLKNSSMAFVRELVGADPVAVFRWAIVRAFFRGYFAFQEAGRRGRQDRVDGNRNNVQQRYQRGGGAAFVPNDNIISKQRSTLNRIARNNDIDVPNSHNRLSWPQIHNRDVVGGGRLSSSNNSAAAAQANANNNNYNSGSRGGQVRGSAGAEESALMMTSTTGVVGRRNVTAAGVGGTFERVNYPYQDQTGVMQKANQIVMKNKSFRPRERSKKGLKNLQSVKTLAGRTHSTQLSNSNTNSSKTRNNKPMTVTGQFQQSLHSLMDTLNQANPFFIRCIKSNGQKVPNHFDEDTVQRQLRYTGMLETVRIRQAGFNVRLTYDEFIQLYRILLPKGLLSSQTDVRHFLSTLNLNRDNYQLGSTKVFLRESEKYKLDSKLHQQIMASIVTLQRWFRSCLERRRFLRVQRAIVTLQGCWRVWLVRRVAAAVRLQGWWRGARQRRWWLRVRGGVVGVQARGRGWMLRRWVEGERSRRKGLLLLHRKKAIRSISAARLQVEVSSNALDEAFISKGSSQEELEMDRHLCVEHDKKLGDSDESSGFLEDLETGHNKISLRSTQSLPSVTQTSLHQTLPGGYNYNTPYRALQNLRLENTDKEGVLLDSTLKRRISKAAGAAATSSLVNTSKTIDLSDIDFHTAVNTSQSHQTPKSSTTGGSEDSLSSSYSTTNYHHPHYRKDWTSSKSETDSTASLDYYHASKSAPPVVDVVSPYNTYYDKLQLQQQQQQQQQSKFRVSPLKRENALTAAGLVSKQRGSRQQQQQLGLVDVLPEKAMQILVGDGNEKPKVPTRSMRRNLVKSLGEEVLSVETDVKTSLPLRPIAESAGNVNKQQQQQQQQDVWIAQNQQKQTSPFSRRNPLTSDLKRRNSDPAATVANLLLSANPNLVCADPSGNNTTTTTTATSSPSSSGASGNVTAERKQQQGGYQLDLEFQSNKDCRAFTMFGHQFRRIQRFSKMDCCAVCGNKMDSFTAQGHRCTECKKFFHVTCIQNKRVQPCDKPQHLQPHTTTATHPQDSLTTVSGTPGGATTTTTTTSSSKSSSSTSGVRRKYRKHNRGTPSDVGVGGSGGTTAKSAVTSKFSLTGMSEFTDSTDQIISDGRELKSMQDFISKKICQIEEIPPGGGGKKQSGVDIVFKQALREFKDNLVQIYSTADKSGFDAYCVQYKDLITNFEQAMETVCQREQKEANFPVTMGVNAFRGFMNEFMTSRRAAEPVEKPGKTKRKKEKKRKAEDYISFAGHSFVLTIINIPMACEICSSFFMWPIERGLVCQSCKVTCHKKCYIKSMNCSKDCNLNAQGNRKLFGATLHSLVCEDNALPVVIEKLLATIEMYGLYTEGLYRKSGVSSKVRELKVKMEEIPDEISFKDYQIHVLASVFKSFLRDMPEPLLTFDCYENFITAANMHDQQDRVATLYDILKKLPKPNYDLMERLTYHLARVALHEETNRMSAASLAIVFAPCILRTNKIIQAQDSLQDISSQTQCIETIISEKFRKLRNTLDDIDTLDTACQAATNRLSSLRSSKVFSPEELMLPPGGVVVNNSAVSSPQQQIQSPLQQQQQAGNDDEEENILRDHIQEIQKEKEHLTSTLPILAHATSDDDMLSTDGDGSLDDISCLGIETAATQQAQSLRHVHHRGPIIRSISSGGSGPTTTAGGFKLKRQLSSDVTGSVKVVDDCEEPPIMV